MSEWILIWARSLTTQQRHNIRSWGVDCPEPPAPPEPDQSLPKRAYQPDLDDLISGRPTLSASAQMHVDAMRQLYARDLLHAHFHGFTGQ